MSTKTTSSHHATCAAPVVSLLAWLTAACGGDANLGSDRWVEPQDEKWGEAAEQGTAGSEASPTGTSELYSGARQVIDFAVEDDRLFVLLGARALGHTGRQVELVACSADDCQGDLQSLWRTTVDALYWRLFAAAPDVFWVDSQTSEVFACSQRGCEEGPRYVGRGSSEFAADAEYVYWVDPGSRLVRCPRAGCRDSEAPNPGPALAPFSSPVVVFGDSLYLNDGYPYQRIVRIPRAGGEEETLYESELPLSEFDVQADGVYFATSVLTGQVMRCPVSGPCSSPEVLADNQRWPQIVRVDGTSVFWANSLLSDLTLMKLASGATPSELASAAYYGSLVEGSTHLYWSELGDQVDRIHRVEK